MSYHKIVFGVTLTEGHLNALLRIEDDRREVLESSSWYAFTPGSMRVKLSTYDERNLRERGCMIGVPLDHKQDSTAGRVRTSVLDHNLRHT